MVVEDDLRGKLGLDLNTGSRKRKLTYRNKVIPQYCIAHPYCARFLASLARAHSARILATWQFLYESKLAREIKGHFLLNEHGDLSFFLHNFDEIIIFFELNEF